MASPKGIGRRWETVVVVLCLLPALAVVVASAIAQAHGCPLDEAEVHPCIVLGQDWGSTLAALFVLGWLALITLPIGLLVLLGVVLRWLIGWLSGRWPKRP